jgi:hypothetical protein
MTTDPVLQRIQCLHQSLEGVARLWHHTDLRADPRWLPALQAALLLGDVGPLQTLANDYAQLTAMQENHNTAEEHHA